MKLHLLFYILISCVHANSQSISINSDGSQPDNSAMLDVKSKTKGVLLPRMSTSERVSISNPAKGLLVFDSTTTTLWFYSGANWLELRGVGTPNFWLPDANGIYYTYGRVGIGITPNNIYPLTVRQPNSNVGNSIAQFESEDVWHSSVVLKSIPNNRQYAFVVGGPTNTEVNPGNFGLLNTTVVKWAFVVNGTNNNVAFGSPSVHSPIPQSTVHVLTGDVNVEQIGSGIILKSPNGQCWRVTVDNSGNLVRTAITCP